MKNRRLSAALKAAKRGWPVFPLQWRKSDGECSCGKSKCDNTAKHPLTSHGLKDASTDPRVIRGWFKKWPKAGYGIVTGAASGLVVLDVDPRHGGRESLQEIVEEHGDLPVGPKVRTGGGGEHVYLAHPGSLIKNKVGILPGIDVRADGGYVVGAGCVHASGAKYLWMDGKMPSKLRLPQMPKWLRKTLGEKSSTQSTSAGDVIPEGHRNTVMASIAGTMRRKGLSPAAIEAALQEENRARCRPPLDEDEVTRIATSISQYPPGFLSPQVGDSTGSANLRFFNGAEIETETVADVDWIARPWLVRGAVTEVVGKVKLAGKTTWISNMARCVLDGAPFMGEPTVKSPVVYLTEQNRTSFRQAMQRANLLGREDLFVLFWPDTVGATWPQVVAAAVQKCQLENAGVLIVDTLGQFTRLVGDSENSAGDALAAVQPLQLAAKEGIAVVMARHERKSGGTVGDSGRGSSAYGGAVDIIVSIRRGEGHARNRRIIQSVSRFDGTPPELLIELTDDGEYRALGEPGEEARKNEEQEVLEALPGSKDDAVDINKLAEVTKKTRAKLQRIVDSLRGSNAINTTGKGKKGDPFRYYVD